MERWKESLARQGIVTTAVSFSPSHVCFVSNFMRLEFENEGIQFPSSEVIYGGVSVAKFFHRRKKLQRSAQPIRFLYAGQIDPQRGLHTAIEALNLLSEEARSFATLTVAGDCFNSNYQLRISQQVQVLGLSDRVIFVGKKSYEDMPELYRSHDVLIAPSLRREGLPLSMAEAMLSGCAVVTTGSGGAMEIARLADLPLFPKEDAPALAQILEGLIHNPHALDRIARRGQEVALREFSSDLMVQRLCTTFQNLCQQKKERKVRDNPIVRDDHDLESVAHGRI
jgi:glycosyltransferase involved in cell wall biosynthesis